MQHSPHEGFKDTLSHLMRNKPLFYTLIVAFAAVLYLVYKHSQGASGTATPGTTGATGTPSSISNTYVTVNKTTPGSVSPIAPAPPTGGPPPKPKTGPGPKVFKQPSQAARNRANNETIADWLKRQQQGGVSY